MPGGGRDRSRRVTYRKPDPTVTEVDREKADVGGGMWVSDDEFETQRLQWQGMRTVEIGS
jgi:hypothetical protein